MSLTGHKIIGNINGQTGRTNKAASPFFAVPALIMLWLGIPAIVAPASLKAAIQDSIGVEKKDGKLYVLHQVDAKETLYSISKRYSAKVEDIKLANPDMGDAIKIGQTIRIPYKGAVSASSGSTASDSKNAGTHTVEKKETLYSISRKYSVTIEELTRLNPGIESGLREGQVLKVPGAGNAVAVPQDTKESARTGKLHQVEPKETLFGIAKKYNVSVDDLKKANPQLIDGLKEGTEIVIPEKGKTTSPTSSSVSSGTSREDKEDKQEVVTQNYHQPKGEFKKVSEHGMAELLESKVEAPKFQALHKTAPVGTIIQVVNESNGQKIFVRVIGKLTDTTDPKTIVKISQKAMDRLEVKDKKVAVVLTYIP